MPKKHKDKTQVYFPGLHGLRFFAALVVVFSHVELLKDYHGYPNLYNSNLAVYESGRIGVTSFFVLSGFLISYLLLTERKVSGTISVKNFYIRRIIRIWPLYYLLVFLTFVVIPRIEFFSIPTYSALVSEHFFFTLTLYVLLLPQVALSIFDPVPYAEPLWSIGVEEQFYLLWPLLIKHFKNFVRLTIAIAVGVVILRQAVLITLGMNRDSPNLQNWKYLLSYLYFTRIECMAIGGIGAWLVFAQNKAILRIIYHPASQLIIFALTAYLLITQRFKPSINYLSYAICFCLIIINISSNPRSFLKLENRVFVFLGNVSFSMYMFHEIVIKFVMSGLAQAGIGSFDETTPNLMLHLFSILLTLAVSALAYYGFEKRFLKLKSRFGVVESGQDLIEKGKTLTPRHAVVPS